MKRATDHLCRADPALRFVIEAVGACRMTYMQPDFHGLARSIVFQQLHGKAAAIIFGRLTALAGDPLDPSRVLALTPEELRSAGLSRQKASYIQDLAARNEEIGFPGLRRLTDDEVIRRLTTVKGIGVWTAHMFLMFGLRRRNILPVGDLGVRMAVQKLYGFESLPTPTQIEQLAVNWSPYCSFASWYLWRSLEIKASYPPE